MKEPKLLRIGQVWKDRSSKIYFVLSLVKDGRKVAMISLTNHPNRFFEPIKVNDIVKISKAKSKKLFDKDFVYIGMVDDVIKIQIKKKKKNEK